MRAHRGFSGDGRPGASPRDKKRTPAKRATSATSARPVSIPRARARLRARDCREKRRARAQRHRRTPVRRQPARGKKSPAKRARGSPDQAFMLFLVRAAPAPDPSKKKPRARAGFLKRAASCTSGRGQYEANHQPTPSERMQWVNIVIAPSSFWTPRSAPMFVRTLRRLAAKHASSKPPAQTRPL